MQNKFYKYKFVDNRLSITNLRDYLVKSKVFLTGVSYQSNFFGDVDFPPNQEVLLDLLYSHFHNVDIENKMSLRIYENGKKVVDDYVSNFIEKAYIIISNDKYEDITQRLIDGLEKYSDVDILHYNINYDSKIKSKNLTNIRMDVDGESDPQFMQFMKPPCFIDAIERGVQRSIFLDSDVLVRPKIDDLFKIPHVTDGPIIQKQRWEFVTVHNQYIPGPLVQKYMGFTGSFQTYANGITFLVIFNKSHLSLFKQWKEVCFSDEIQEIRKTEFLHDESLLNCLLWKNKITPQLINVGLNIVSEKDVKFFYQIPNLGKDFLTDVNEYGIGHYAQSFIPYDKNDILFFHCVKDLEIADNINRIIEVEESDNRGSEEYFKNKLIDFYSNISENKKIKSIDPKFNLLFHDGAFLEIKDVDEEMDVSFIDTKTNQVKFNLKLGNNCWAKTSEVYHIDWKIVAENSKHRFEYHLNYKDKRVFISFESSALGDTLAWIPYVEEFRKKWNCHVVCSTFWNHLFKDSYKEIEFIEPGMSTPNIFGIYRIGWFYDGEDFRKTVHKNNFRLQPLQKTASDILGLDFEEIKPNIKLKDGVEKENIISIGIHGTAQTKYWNNPTGWQEITDYFKSLGYRVVIISKEGDNYMGNRHPIGAEKANTSSIDDVIEILQKSKLFIGIGSGLSWLSWATGTPTVLISGFSYDYTEPLNGVVRINSISGKCSGCFNDYRLDPGDWNWCPLHKGTERQFECSKSITSQKVIEEINKSGFLN
jgi:autotransporter strand-loop-strand O-heptosyltransferase